jgi:hypothetical protein
MQQRQQLSVDTDRIGNGKQDEDGEEEEGEKDVESRM